VRWCNLFGGGGVYPDRVGRENGIIVRGQFGRDGRRLLVIIVALEEPQLAV
jgi:hypothetical protein